MSLTTLVAFAQANFAAAPDALNGRPDAATPDSGLQTAAPLRRPRLPVPEWLRNRQPEQDLPNDGSHPWRIEGPLPLSQPPPDVDMVGPDALAFYIPFHFYRQGWGIFVRMSGVVHVASILKGRALGSGDEHYLNIAEAFLREHEMFHAAVEVACTRTELLARQAVFLPYFDLAAAAEHEEALANASAVRRCFGSDDFLAARLRIEEWLSRLGAGYRDYHRWLSAQAFSRGQEKAVRFIVEHLPGPAPSTSTSLHTFLFRGSLRYPSMPTVRVNDLGPSAASILRPFPKAFGLQVLVYSNEHPPPHIHIRVADQNYTRYAWPTLEPLRGEKALPGQARKALERYLKDHGVAINRRVETVYSEYSGRAV